MEDEYETHHHHQSGRLTITGQLLAEPQQDLQNVQGEKDQMGPLQPIQLQKHAHVYKYDREAEQERVLIELLEGKRTHAHGDLEHEEQDIANSDIHRDGVLNLGNLAHEGDLLPLRVRA